MPSAGRFPIVAGGTTIAGFMNRVANEPRPDGELNLVRWMTEGGLRSSYYRDTIPDFARFVGLVDDDGATQLWAEVRDPDEGRRAFGDALRAAYADVLGRFGLENVSGDDRDRLAGYFRANANAGAPDAEAAADTLIRAFDYAEGRDPVTPARGTPRVGRQAQARTPRRREQQTAPSNRSQSPRTPSGDTGQRVSASLAVNVQIVLPPDATDERYEAMLSAIARHLRALLD